MSNENRHPFSMVIQHAYVISIIEHNETDEIKELLDFISPKDYNGWLSDSHIFLSVLILEYASAFQGALFLSEKSAQLLIEHLAMHVNYGNFIDLFLRRCRHFGHNNLSLVDPTVVEAIDSPTPYNAELAERISHLNEDQFMALVHHLSDLARDQFQLTMDCRLFPVFIQYIYDHELVPREIVLAYMRMSL